MRDTISLKGREVTYENVNYKIEDFCLLQKKNEIFVKLKNLTENIYLNLPLATVLLIIK